MSEIQKPVYQQNIDEVLERFHTDQKGLTGTEAARRFREQGPNLLVGIKKDPAWLKYIHQYKDWMIFLLAASVAVSLYLGDVHTAAVLVALILFNTIIGFAQEYRAEKTMQALERLVKPTAEAMRDGSLVQVDSSKLVCGDIIRLTEGQSIPADVRIIQRTSFATNDFALTGESNPSRKFTHALESEVPLGNRHNLAFMGTTAAMGEAMGVVVAIGMNTELGRIASLSQAAPEDASPLQKEVRHIATYVTYGVAILCAVLLAVAMKINLPIKDALLFAVGVASSLIPQGLPAEVNTSLAQAAGKLARARALVKKLSAVETLGATRVICTDKTGTLTKNQMTVESFVVDGTTYGLSGTGYAPVGTLLCNGRGVDDATKQKLGDFLAIGAYASNARLVEPSSDNPEWSCLGDPTEGALVSAAGKAGVTAEHVAAVREVREYPFDSARKRMTSVREQNGETVAYVKGAPESVLEQCTHIIAGGKIRKITSADRQAIIDEHTNRAKRALRNLAFATRAFKTDWSDSLTHNQVEQNLVYHGLVSMIDPLRESVPEAVRVALAANVRINIVTGDFALTAEALARQAGLIAENEEALVITGEDLAKMHDNDVLAHSLKGSVIFSRVSPEDKMRIVRLIKQSGTVVAVTGDGINDAPALTYADIGVAMGVTGTDVAKQASEVVLLDDSFSSLVSAIRQGRTIYANIKKGVLSCFTSNSTELVVNMGGLGLTSMMGIPLPLNVLQLLAIDMLAELFPIAALGWDKEEGEIMRQQPRNLNDHILNRRSITDLVWSGLVMGALALGNFLLVLVREGVDLHHPVMTSDMIAHATTMTYVTIVIAQLINITQRRSTHGLFTRYQFHNPVYWGSIVLSLGIVLSICYVPVVSGFFNSAPLTAVDWLYVLAAGATYAAIREVTRLTIRRAV
jgi:Ca2+-transporting ATPase